MKLLVDIEDRLFRQVQRLTKAKTKKEAIVIPMREYVRQHARQELADLIGNFDMDMTLADLRHERKKWKNF